MRKLTQIKWICALVPPLTVGCKTAGNVGSHAKNDGGPAASNVYDAPAPAKTIIATPAQETAHSDGVAHQTGLNPSFGPPITRGTSPYSLKASSEALADITGINSNSPSSDQLGLTSSSVPACSVQAWYTDQVVGDGWGPLPMSSDMTGDFVKKLSWNKITDFTLDPGETRLYWPNRLSSDIRASFFILQWSPSACQGNFIGDAGQMLDAGSYRITNTVTKFGQSVQVESVLNVYAFKANDQTWNNVLGMVSQETWYRVPLSAQ